MSIVLDSNKIGSVAEYIKQNTEAGADISVSSDVFTIFAYQELMDILNKCNSFRFLYKEPTFLENNEDEKRVKEFEVQRVQRERSISENNYEISLKNNLMQTSIANKCAAFIKDKAEVKSVLRYNSVSSNNIMVKNNDEKGFLISGNSLSFSKMA